MLSLPTSSFLVLNNRVLEVLRSLPCRERRLIQSFFCRDIQKVIPLLEHAPILTSRIELAATMSELEETKEELKADKSKIAILFSEMSQMCLWCVFFFCCHDHILVKLSHILGEMLRYDWPYASICTGYRSNRPMKDLSLLTNLTHEDILKLQSVGKDSHEERKAFILHDDEKDAFAHLSSQNGARVDFVLDNGAP